MYLVPTHSSSYATPSFATHHLVRDVIRKCAVTLSYTSCKEVSLSIPQYTTRISLVCLRLTSPPLFQVLLLIPGVLNFSFTDTELSLMSQLAVFVRQVQSSC